VKIYTHAYARTRTHTTLAHPAGRTRQLQHATNVHKKAMR